MSARFRCRRLSQGGVRVHRGSQPYSTLGKPCAGRATLTALSALEEVKADTVAKIAACGRARWKIENETFNVLKTNGYNLEHNFGYGKETLASVLVVLNLLAFGFHTAMLTVLAWRQAVVARGATYRFFEHLPTITAYAVFQNWDHLLRRSIAAAAIRPP
jgi:hypothetical protein